MQPTQRFKKTLLAGALLFGACNAFNASAENFIISATGIPDVVAAPVANFTTLGFGANIKGNKITDTCTIVGKSDIPEADLRVDLAPTGTDNAGTTFGDISGNACLTSSTDGAAMIIEIDGVAGSTVSVEVQDVTGAGYTYTPGAESCVVDFDQATTADLCKDFGSSSIVNGIGMSLVQTANVSEIPTGATAYALATGKTRMILAGTITIDAPGIAQGVSVSDPILVTITYE